MIWFTSDTHFGHANIIDYCKRPFATLLDMDNTMVERWNARVKPEDEVYHLGDFSMGSRKNIAKYRAALNGRITLIQGNHDRSVKCMLESGFESVMPDLLLFLPGAVDVLFLQHRPEFSGKWKGAAYHLHGHVHEKWARRGNLINVGVDVRNFEPKTLEELLAGA